VPKTFDKHMPKSLLENKRACWELCGSMVEHARNHEYTYLFNFGENTCIGIHLHRLCSL